MRLHLVCVLLQTPSVHSYQYEDSMSTIPDYITRASPQLYLYSEEKYMPGSIEEFVQQFYMSTSEVNSTERIELSNLRAAGQRLRDHVDSSHASLYLSAKHTWEHDPAWVTAVDNRPNPLTGRIKAAPAVLIVVDKGDFVDAFWFYFYPFNEGPYVMGRGPFGNHLGDWEHSLVRFRNEKPELLWMSAHGGGAAYKWSGLEFAPSSDRPVIYAARGTHANYVSIGQHSHDIPWHMLSDFSDRGELWDPAQNYVAYTFDGHIVRPANGSEVGREHRYGDWLLYDGCWGNKQLDPSDPRQAWSPWQWLMIDGPRGPLFKSLMRQKPCERHKWWNLFGVCRIRRRMTPGEGVEADMLTCPLILGLLPTWLRFPVSLIVRGGYLCYVLDLLWA